MATYAPPPAYDYNEKKDQGGYPVVQQPAGNVIYKMVQPVLFHSPYPQNLVCSGCEQSVVTYTRESFGKKTGWGIAAFFCGLGLLGFWIPLVVSSFKDVEHRCPRCNSFLGTFRPSPRGAKIAFGILTVLCIAFTILYITVISAALSAGYNEHHHMN